MTQGARFGVVCLAAAILSALAALAQAREEWKWPEKPQEPSSPSEEFQRRPASAGDARIHFRTGGALRLLPRGAGRKAPLDVRFRVGRESQQESGARDVPHAGGHRRAPEEDPAQRDAPRQHVVPHLPSGAPPADDAAGGARRGEGQGRNSGGARALQGARAAATTGRGATTSPKDRSTTSATSASRPRTTTARSPSSAPTPTSFPHPATSGTASPRRTSGPARRSRPASHYRKSLELSPDNGDALQKLRELEAPPAR